MFRKCFILNETQGGKYIISFIIESIRWLNEIFIMELFIALGLPIVLLVGFTLLFMVDGIPSWIQNLNRNSTNIWNFGIVVMSTMTVIIYLAKK